MCQTNEFNEEIILFLIKNGANVNERIDDCNMIHLVSNGYFSNYKLMRILLENKADPNQKSKLLKKNFYKNKIKKLR